MFLVALVNYTAFGKQYIDILTSQFILVIGVLKKEKSRGRNRRRYVIIPRKLGRIRKPVVVIAQGKGLFFQWIGCKGIVFSWFTKQNHELLYFCFKRVVKLYIRIGRFNRHTF